MATAPARARRTGPLKHNNGSAPPRANSRPGSSRRRQAPPSKGGQASRRGRPAPSRSRSSVAIAVAAPKGRQSTAIGTAKGRRAPTSPASREGTSGPIEVSTTHRLAMDVGAIGLGTISLLAAIAVYGGPLGPAGHYVRSGLGDLLGVARFALPLAAAAIALAIPRTGTGRAGRRQLVAWSMIVVAVSGLSDVAAGLPGLTASQRVHAGSGGWTGVALGGSLRAGMGNAGAVTVLVALALGGILLAGGRPIRELVRSTCRTWSRLTVPPASDASALTPPGMPPGDEPSRHVESPLDAAMPSGTELWPETGDIAGVAGIPGRDRTSPDFMDPSGAVRRQDGTGGSVSTDGVGSSNDLGIPYGEGAPGTFVPTAIEDIQGQFWRDGDTGAPSGGAHSSPVRPGGHPQWRLPPLSLLARSKPVTLDKREVEAIGRSLVATLSSHGVDTRLSGFTVGPTVTRFELELGPGVKVARVTSLSKDIAYALASPDVRILAPIPGKSAIGIEAPNRERELVTLGDLYYGKDSGKVSHPLSVPIGRDISGRSVLVNLADMPHVLISGATGSGKSSCINSLLTALVLKASPDQLRLILVDPKRVELGPYSGLPHLLTDVVVDPRKAANALAWAVAEMDRRYELLAGIGARDITGYNEAALFQSGNEDAADLEPLPFIVVVVDELNDLMMVAARDVEDSVCRIAQMARAVGVHLVLATQRPSVDVITGVIKANIPSRMAFAVSSLADSRVILDAPGAERLVSKGDMLMVTASSSVPRRVQGAWVGPEEVRAVVAHWRRQKDAEYVAGIDGTSSEGVAAKETGDDDELFGAAMELVVNAQLGSTSMLQRKLKVGFARAGRLMDLLERKGVVGPSEGSKARAVLMTPDELVDMRSRAPES